MQIGHEVNTQQRETIAAVGEYLRSCLIEWTGMPILDTNRRRLRDKLEKFLGANSSDQDAGKMFLAG